MWSMLPQNRHASYNDLFTHSCLKVSTNLTNSALLVSLSTAINPSFMINLSNHCSDIFVIIVFLVIKYGQFLHDHVTCFQTPHRINTKILTCKAFCITKLCIGPPRGFISMSHFLPFFQYDLNFLSCVCA